MAEIKFEIVEHLGVIADNKKGWQKEINRVKWNDRPAKYDIRDWSADHTKMSKGITLNDDEVVALRQLLTKLDI